MLRLAVGMKRRTLLINAAGAAACMPRMSGAGELPPVPEGFFVPAEDRQHLRCFMQWPVSLPIYGSRRSLEHVQQTIATIANTISEFEPVVMLADRQNHAGARKLLAADIALWDVATEDLWCRDSGALFLIGQGRETAICQMNFNGWGRKQRHRHDGQIARKVAEILDLPLYDSGLTGEPGGVEQDGTGTLIAHEICWINRNRNSLSKSEISSRMLRAYGAQKLIWAKGFKGQDITDDHFDGLARFSAPGKMLMQLPASQQPDDIWGKSALATYRKLKSATDATGQALAIRTLPDPDSPRVTSYDFAATYMNFYVANGVVLAPQFGDPAADERAKNLLATAFPGREIVQLNIDWPGRFGGGIHCATQQQPQA